MWLRSLCRDWVSREIGDFYIFPTEPSLSLSVSRIALKQEKKIKLTVLNCPAGAGEVPVRAAGAGEGGVRGAAEAGEAGDRGGAGGTRPPGGHGAAWAGRGHGKSGGPAEAAGGVQGVGDPAG